MKLIRKSDDSSSSSSDTRHDDHKEDGSSDSSSDNNKDDGQDDGSSDKKQDDSSSDNEQDDSSSDNEQDDTTSDKKQEDEEDLVTPTSDVNLKSHPRCPKYGNSSVDSFGSTFFHLHTKVIKNKILNNKNHQFLCLICYKPVTDSKSVFILEQCHHLYHNECVMAWFVDQERCPTCSVKPEESFYY